VVLERLLRGELRFTGLTITDALDMHALAQGAAQTVEVIAALRAGEDLLLATADQELVDRVEQASRHAERRGLLDRGASAASLERVARAREWLAGFEQPPLEVVGSAEHRTLARELAERSITLVRNHAGLLPLRLESGVRIAAVQPQPADLTPADTSSYVRPTLGEAIRRRWPDTDDIITPADPSDAEIAALRDRLAEYDVVVVGTSAAHLRPAHSALANAAMASGTPTVTVAVRTPWDLLAYPAAETHVCTYSILDPSMDALAAALFGDATPAGRLPVQVGSLHDRGHGLPQWR
jgi:beta-N-acetylhexosaminidase